MNKRVKLSSIRRHELKAGGFQITMTGTFHVLLPYSSKDIDAEQPQLEITAFLHLGQNSKAG